MKLPYLLFACAQQINYVETHVQVTLAWAAFVSVELSRTTNSRDDFTDSADDTDGGRYNAIDLATDATDGRNNTANHVSDCKDASADSSSNQRETMMTMSSMMGVTYEMPVCNLWMMMSVSIEGVPLVYDIAYICSICC
jgi:hypothetical protein